ncbi:type II/IV secretion system ATPase subunit [Vulcanisaeta thermophila]|uniref:type II/IV secretion system ATPase subunit n=1 Tax=Vulcanisaeta thermophila TaxID=867917 RepID=UPI00085318CD|nr:type II/IV secretion system ATPase subunit [Vulcanisaeta thermophila]
MGSGYTVNVSIDGFRFRIPVNIVANGGEYYYVVNEPRCGNTCAEVKGQVLSYMRRFNVDVLEAVNQVVRDLDGVDKQDFEAALYYLLRDIRSYGPITVPLFDEYVEEVELNNWSQPVTVVHRELPGIRLVTNIRFEGEVEAREFIYSFSRRGLPRNVSLMKPYIETILPEGHRFTGTIGEITLGPTFSIRKFPEKPMTLEDLVSRGMLKPSTAAYLWLIAELKGFIMISGPMSSGKTTLLSAIAGKLPMYSKVVTIEDTPEIKIPHPHWVRMFTKDGDEKSRVEMFDLVRLAVRYRPDYIIVGEVRGEEVHALFQASALGHGMLTTFHASTPNELIIRLTSPPLNVNPGNLQLLSTVVFTAIRNGRRQVVNVMEPRWVNGRLEFMELLNEQGEVDVERSVKVRELGRFYGIDVNEELKRRTKLLTMKPA